MKKKFIYSFIIFLFCFTKNVFAETYFAISPIYSLKNGCLNEIVFQLFDDEPTRLSELNWNIKNISYIGGNFSFGNEFVTIETQVMKGFSKRSACMYDSDWQDLPQNPSVKTTFSISENTLKDDIYIDWKVSIKKNLNNSLSIGAFVKEDFESICFSAKNGYGWYGSYSYSQNGQNVPYDSVYAKFFGTGSLNGIDYLRLTKSIHFGLFCGLSFIDRIFIQFEGGVSPCTFVKSIDHHHTAASNAERYYLDEIKADYSLFDISTDLKVKLNKSFLIGTSFSYSTLNETKGLTYSKLEPSGYEELEFTDGYSCDTMLLSGCSGTWYTIKAYCTFVF